MRRQRTIRPQRLLTSNPKRLSATSRGTDEANTPNRHPIRQPIPGHHTTSLRHGRDHLGPATPTTQPTKDQQTKIKVVYVALAGRK
jgi:hypothetical protein